MSSILNALRKLESDPPTTVRARALSNAIIGHKKLRHNILPPGRRTVTVIALFCLLAAVVIGHLYIKKNRVLPRIIPLKFSIFANEASPPRSTTPVTKPITKKVAARETRELTMEPSNTARQKKESRKSVKESVEKPPSRRALALRPTDSSPSDASQINVNKADRAYEQTSHSMPRPVVKTTRKRLVTRSNKPSRTVTPTDTSLILQAIAWSDNPSERIAVISGQILREGDSSEGITITGIEKDAVSIQEGSKRIMLKFSFK